MTEKFPVITAPHTSVPSLPVQNMHTLTLEYFAEGKMSNINDEWHDQNEEQCIKASVVHCWDSYPYT